MLKHKDICIIIGKLKSGKTLLSKTLAKSIQSSFIYFDYNFVDSELLYDFYDKNKNYSRVIIFDNYVRLIRNEKVDSIFKKNKNFTIIYVMNYIDITTFNCSDIIYIAKETNFDQIKHYHEILKKYYDEISLDWVTNAMEDLKEYGFISFDKDKRFSKKELYLEI